jgi:GNAT superfamily N-acetyltransferase
MRKIVAPLISAIGFKRCYLGCMGLDPPPAFPSLPDGCRIAPFRGPDLQILGPQAMDPAMTEQRLACGDRPWGLWKDRELLCYGWSSTRPTSILTMTMVVPGPHEAYLYGFYTPPPHRGKGYYPLLLRQIGAQLAQEGSLRAWIAVFDHNAASWKGVLKAGFRKTTTQLSLHGRLSWTQAERVGPQPSLRPRLRGLHMGMLPRREAAGSAPREARPR